eukprot:gene11540-4793_t
MKFFILVALLVFIIIQQTNSFQLVTKSNLKNRYNNIFFPTEKWDDFPRELFDYKIFVAPATWVIPELDLKDLCAGFENYQINWNDTKSCENYFCRSEEPIYLQIANNKNNSIYIREDAFIKHLSVQRYCTVCNQTAHQIMKVEDLKQCTFFNNQSCPDSHCPGDSFCLTINLREVTEKRPFEASYPICYDFQENIFYAHLDFTHKFIFWIYFRYTQIFNLIFSSLFFLFFVICLVIPEIFHTIQLFRKLKKDMTFKIGYYSIFSIKNISLFIYTFCIILNVFASIFDLTGVVVVRLITFMNSINVSNIVFNYLLSILTWKYILTIKYPGSNRGKGYPFII